MSGEQDQDQKTEAPTPKRRREAMENGDVLQSRELGTAMVVMMGAAWMAIAGPMMVGAMQDLLGQGLTFGAVLFSAGLSIALPVAFAIILVQIVMGLLARSAPQLNLFAVGFPAALLAGIVLLAIAAPVIGEGINAAIGAGLDEARRLALGG